MSATATQTPAPRRRRGRLIRRLLAGVLALLLVALVGGYLYAKPLLLTGTGYAAHNACALAALAGRQDAASDLPPNPLVPFLRTSTSADGSSTTTTVLGVLAGQTAYAGPGGCTIGAAPQLDLPAPAQVTIDPTRNPFSTAPAPAPSTTWDPLLAKAFGDDLDASGKKALGTRAVLVIHDGRLVAERYAPGFSANTRQLGWSMAKSVTNLLVGRLVAQGRLAVTDDHLRPEWTDRRAAITVDQLMRMTSGLSWNEDYDLGTPITRMLYLEPDMGRYAASQPLAHEPGSYQQYSSGSTNLLCSVLRARTGSGAALPWRELYQPLGLSSAVWETDAAGTPVCSSYLWATPRDWAALGQLALQDGTWQGQRLLPEGWMARSTTVLPGQGEETGYAAGWWANRLADGSLVDPALPAEAYWANGHDGQRVVVVPSAKLVVVRLGFSPSIKTPDTLRVLPLVKDAVAATR
ncbi:MAG TPA: serine hydrolase [Dermatophilaceae bacterium]|nr:serine hydrolase [Dermatophilaceae bacterium]